MASEYDLPDPGIWYRTGQVRGHYARNTRDSKARLVRGYVNNYEAGISASREPTNVGFQDIFYLGHEHSHHIDALDGHHHRSDDASRGHGNRWRATNAGQAERLFGYDDQERIRRLADAEGIAVDWDHATLAPSRRVLDRDSYETVGVAVQWVEHPKLDLDLPISKQRPQRRVRWLSWDEWAHAQARLGHLPTGGTEQDRVANGSVRRSANDLARMATAGRRVVESSVDVDIPPDTMAAMAAETLAEYAGAQVQFGGTVQALADLTPGDVALGDTIPFEIDHGWARWAGTTQIRAVHVSVDAEGTETFSVEHGPVMA